MEEHSQQVTAPLAKGHIQLSCSPYCSPVLVVHKATGGLAAVQAYKLSRMHTLCHVLMISLTSCMAPLSSAALTCRVPKVMLL